MIIIILVILILIFIKLRQNFTNVSPKKIAVITSIYGNYESIKNHENVKNKELFDWYCFTDNENLKSNTWKIINKPYHLLNTSGNFKNNYQNINDDFTKNMMSAKYYKAQTHNIDILKDYDYYIWVDGSLFLRDSFVNNVLKLLNSEKYPDLINFKHSSRNNIKDEVFYCKDWKKYIKQDLKYQYDDYIKDGFPDNIGLFELTSFYRKNDTIVNDAFDLWWEHNLKYSYQDQVSFPYILWKFNKINHKILNENVMKNKNYCYNGSHLIKI